MWHDVLSTWLTDLRLDVRYAVRTLRRSRAFSATVILLVGVGVGANVAVFSVLKAVYMNPLPHPAADRLVVLWERSTGGGRGPASWPNYLDWSAENRTFDALAATSPLRLSLADGEVVESVPATRATSSLFDVLGTEPALGRVLLPEEDAADARVAVLSNELWTTRYGGDPRVVGETIRLGGEPYTVVGVMPEGFGMRSVWDASEEIQVWIPFFSDVLEEGRDSHSYPVYGRLRDGVSLEQARADLDRVAVALADAYPDTNLTQRVRVDPLREVLFGPLGYVLAIMLGAAALVLLIACGNVASLVLARSAGRRAEITVRSVLGAGRGRVLRQLMAETSLLAAAGGALAIALAYWGVDTLKGSLPFIPRLADSRVDGTVLAFALGATILTGFLFGLAPALLASRADHAETLKEASHRTTGGRSRFRKGFLVAQLALTLVLVHSTAVLVGSYVLLRGTELGFDRENALTAALVLPEASYPEAGDRGAFLDELLPRLEAIPGVAHAAAVNRLPLQGGTNSRVIVEGREIPPDPNQRPLVERRSIAGDYLETVGTALRAGRPLEASDSVSAAPGVLINQRMAEQLWPGEDPLGKRFSFQTDPPRWLTVVGVTENVRQWGLEFDAIAEAYRPYMLMPQTRMNLVLRTDVEPTSLVPAVRRTLREVDPELPLMEILTLDQLVGFQLRMRETMTGVIGLFTLLALLLAVTGIYSVVSAFVVQRRHELGVRMALGAGRRDVRRLVLGQGSRLAVLGILLGVPCAFAATRVIRSLVYGLSPTSPWFLTGVALLLLLVATLAALIPAQRATTVDAVRALQAE